MTFDGIVYTVLTLFAVYGMYTALHEAVSFFSRILGKGRDAGKCRGCKMRCDRRNESGRE